MSLLADIFEGGTAGIFRGIRDVVSTFKADPLEVMRIQQAIAQAELNATTALAQAQTKINEIEAANANVFISGWRPAIGWICGGAYLYHFILEPFLLFALTMAGVQHAPLPKIELSELSVVLFGMLGLGAMRSFDKMKKA